MATNIKTVMTYPLDGSTTDFNIPFEYLARKFVRVTLIGVDRKELILNQDYRFATKTTISTTRALGPADGYTLIEIRRFTSATDRLVDFTDGSILRAYDLNISQVQTLHVAEEARDLTADTIGVNNDGNLDARGRRIVNVADAQDVGDAINLGQIQRWNDSALNSANRAKQEADRATARANDANNSANASASSASSSAGSAELSKQWAVKETAVEPNLESSRTYALHSMSYRNEAKDAADRAKTSEANAKDSESNAKNSEANAKSSEAKAKASEERAIEEASKLGNMNDFAAAIDSVDGIHVTMNGNINSPGNITGGGLVSTGAASIQKGALVGEDLIVERDITAKRDMYSQRNIAVAGVTYAHGGINQTLSPNVYNKLSRLHIDTNPQHVGQRQGLHIGWNEGGSGESNFITNRGAGSGGFVFRTVNAENSVETGRVDITGGGVIYASHLQVRSGARIEENNNIVGQNLYAGMGSTMFEGNGNLTGGIWAQWGNLWSGLNNNSLFAKPPGGVQLFTARGGDYLEGRVDGTAVGFRWFKSDRRLKEDIKVVRSADDMLNIIRSYIPVSYKYKDASYTDNRGRTNTIEGKRSRAGFITQDLIRLWPEAVDVMSDGIQSPDPNQIIGGLMLLVKNLDARVQELESKLMTD
ncbi:tail fibers protein [Enterobacter phage E-4]|uniref:Tail fibers protein n=1 Tax=Enterobacter phage E-2 TaxID=1636313 RepID=A0A0E3JQ96_9CAUD|nr:tail fiber protein [Enterobacter phage E-2]AKA61571.1 tail fibers protein [Enterobacter phage E-2]AKA61659.1 tail fibers protein [Enterobacter phage E-4]